MERGSYVIVNAKFSICNDGKLHTCMSIVKFQIKQRGEELVYEYYKQQLWTNLEEKETKFPKVVFLELFNKKETHQLPILLFIMEKGKHLSIKNKEKEKYLSKEKGKYISIKNKAF